MSAPSGPLMPHLIALAHQSLRGRRLAAQDADEASAH